MNKLQRLLKKNRQPGESRRAQARRLGLPESSLRKVEATGKPLSGAAGVLLMMGLGA
jgi:hypothetical protein